jgi:autotransporter-associated beta strand protein
MVMGNEFVAYRSTSDGGVPLGYVQVTNGSMRSDAADGTAADQLRSATASTEIMRFTGTATVTLAGNATWRAIKMDGGTTRTIALGTNTLTVDRGAINHVGNDQRIGEATGTGFLQSGTSELQLTVNGGTSIIGARVQNGPAGMTHLVKNGGGTLRFDGANSNTFTGNIHLNAGLLVNNAANHVPTTATINFNGGRWEPNVTVAGPNADIAMGNNIVVNANSRGIGGDPALSLDNGTGGEDNNYLFGSVTINNGVEWSIAGHNGMEGNFNATAINPHVFNATPTLVLFQGRAGAAANEAVMTFNGPISGSYYVQSIGAVIGTNPSNTTLQIGGGAADSLGNTGDVTLLGNGAGTGMPILRLNKAPGTNAVGGTLTVNGGQVINLANEQIADTSSVIINGDPVAANQFGWQLNNTTETIRNLTINGGGVSTGTGTLNITGDFAVNIGSQADTLQINSGGTVNVGGTTTMGDFGRVVLGASAATMVLNGPLVMNGGVIQQNNGAGANILRLNANVTATSSQSATSRIANIDDSDTFVELNGNRIFTVNDGPQGNDLIVSGTMRNSTGVGATAGGITKAGTGTMVIGGSFAAPNTISGSITVNAGALHLAKIAGQNAFASSSVTVNATGSLVVRNSNQIPDTTDVTLNGTGILDIQSFSTSENIRNLTGAIGAITRLGPTSSLGVTITTDTVYAGSIVGGGALTAVTKAGSAKWTLSGTSEYSGDTVVTGGILEVNGFLNGTETNVKTGATLAGTGVVSDVVLESGSFLAPGNSPGILTTRNLDAQSGSTLTYELNGLTGGSGYDQLKARGAVTLGATSVFNFTALAGINPDPNVDTFFLLWNDGSDPISGMFQGLPELAPVTVDGQLYYATYQANAEGNSRWGGNDFALIPEPSGAMLVLISSAGLLLRRRRRDEQGR